MSEIQPISNNNSVQSMRETSSASLENPPVSHINRFEAATAPSQNSLDKSSINSLSSVDQQKANLDLSLRIHDGTVKNTLNNIAQVAGSNTIDAWQQTWASDSTQNNSLNEYLDNSLYLFENLAQENPSYEDAFHSFKAIHTEAKHYLAEKLNDSSILTSDSSERRNDESVILGSMFNESSLDMSQKDYLNAARASYINQAIENLKFFIGQ